MRRGFTLLELLLALVLTAVAVTLAASALRAATQLRERTAQHQQQGEQRARWASLLTDMLRHAPPADAVEEPLLRVVDRADGTAALIFLSQGVRPPFGTGAPWRVTVQQRPDGVALEAIPLGRSPDGSSLRAVAPGVRAFSVQLLEPATARDPARWRRDWPLSASRPTAVALQLEETAVAGASERTVRPTTSLLVALDPLQDVTLGRP